MPQDVSAITFPFLRCGSAALALALAALCAAPALAEKADRSKPMSIEADKPGSVDLQRQVVIFNGNVVISQGTMVLRADRVELRERPDGYREAMAIGSAERPASFRQKRDGVDETVEGAAERIEFDARSDTLRFVGNAAVRRLRAGTVADEITGSLITWDNTNELFKVTGGAASPTNPTGRVRAVFAPREDSAASAPKAADPVPLSPSNALGVTR
ncbi:MAG: OstA-like protein [Proteobacteria bacterium]|nr:OstA-like protein [Pseudomonadota bacterium]